MRIRAIRRQGAWVTVALLIVVMMGWLGAQVMASWDLPDDSYAAGLWDDGDEDALLRLVWDHSPGTLPGIPTVASSRAPLPTEAGRGHSRYSVPVASFDSRAPPLPDSLTA